MKKLQILTVLTLTLSLGATSVGGPIEITSKESRRDLRLLLRLSGGGYFPPPSVSKPKPTKPKPTKPKGGVKKGLPSESWPIGHPTRYYDGFKIVGGGPEFFERIVKNLKRLEKETPLFYKMAKKQVAVRGHIHWNKGGSKAYSRLGKITLGKRDWDYSVDWFFVTMRLNQAESA